MKEWKTGEGTQWNGIIKRKGSKLYIFTYNTYMYNTLARKYISVLNVVIVRVVVNKGKIWKRKTHIQTNEQKTKIKTYRNNWKSE